MAKLPMLIIGIVVWAAFVLGATGVVHAQDSSVINDQTTNSNVDSSPPGTAVITNGLCAGASLQVTGNCASTGIISSSANSQLNNLIKTTINTLSLVVGIISVFMIIFGGLRYVTSGGNDSNVTSAKNTILYAIIGLVVVAMSQFIVRFVLNKLTTS